MIKLVSLPAILSLIIFSIGGYSVRYFHEKTAEVAKNEAYTKAFESYYTQLIKMTRNAAAHETETKTHRDDARKAAKAAAIDAANIRKWLDEVKKETKNAKDVRSSAGDIFKKISSLEPVKASQQFEDNVAKTLLNDANFVNSVAHATNNEIEKMRGVLVRANSKWGKQRDEAGYGFAAWKHTDRFVSCPSGSYVSGIRVRYSGTCLNQCEADGGIIREIVLQCHSIF